MKTTERIMSYIKKITGNTPEEKSNFSSNNSSTPPAGAATEKGVDTEITRQRGPGGFTEFQNPDDLVAGNGLDIYDKMMTDAQVRMAVNHKRFAVISSDWDILPASTSGSDREVAEFVRFCFNDMKGSLVQSVFGILNSLVHGYSISEMVFRPFETGPFAGKWGLEKVKPKHPEPYDFDIDPYGNITALWLTDENGKRSRLPMWKFIIYTYLPEFGRPWGRSDLRAVYKHWWSKDFLLKWWNIYLETFGAPTRVGKYPAGATSVTKQEDLKSVLRDIVNNTAITLPDDMDIEFITSSGDAGFEKAIEYHDRQIVKGILGQTLTSDEGNKSGSYALGNVHMETLEDYVTFLRRDIAESVLQEQIIRRLVDFNFSGVTNYPKFSWYPRKKEIAVSSVSDISTLIESGVVDRADFDLLREHLGLPLSSKKAPA